MNRLAGTLAVVTGSTQGLGAAVARAFAQAGAAGIVTCGRNTDKGEALAVSFQQVVHPVLGEEAGVVMLQRFVGGPDERAQECPSDAP